ncbi:MAG: hypothetical protein WA208_05665 [Thermoanaerobaculia bacterium]
MARTIEELENEVLQLELRDRAALAKVLLESLETLPRVDYPSRAHGTLAAVGDA